MELLKEYTDSPEGKKAIDAFEKFGKRMAMASKVMSMLPEITDILQNGEPAVVELVDDDIVVNRYSEV